MKTGVATPKPTTYETNIKPYQFKKGKIATPSGRPRLSEELKVFKQFSHQEISRYIAKYGRMPAAEIQKTIEDPTCQAIEVAIGKIFQQCMENGDYQRLNFLLDRGVGKVPDVIMDLSDCEGNRFKDLPMPQLIDMLNTILPNALAVNQRKTIEVEIENIKGEKVVLSDTCAVNPEQQRIYPGRGNCGPDVGTETITFGPEGF
jgi:hypothetical protein